MIKKFKAMLIACLCAVTTFVTLGAVKSTTTARADDTTTDYIYRDTTVAAVSVNADLPAYPRLELTGTDFKIIVRTEILIIKLTTFQNLQT